MLIFAQQMAASLSQGAVLILGQVAVFCELAEAADSLRSNCGAGIRQVRLKLLDDALAQPGGEPAGRDGLDELPSARVALSRSSTSGEAAASRATGTASMIFGDLTLPSA